MKWALVVIGIVALLLMAALFVVDSGHTMERSGKPRIAERASFTRVQVSQNSPAANEIFLSRSESGIFYMGWNDYRSVSWSNGYVHLGFSYSTDGGMTWSANQILGNDSDNDFHDAAGDPVVVPGNGDDVYYLLMEFNSSESNLKHSQLVVKKSTDHGQTWTDEVRIWPYDVDKPWAVFWNGDLYVAWDNVSSGYMEFTHTIGGDFHSWAPIKDVGPVMYPGMAINESGTLYIAGVYSSYFGNYLYVYISTDGGNSFNSHQISTISSNAWESNPRSGPIPQMAAMGPHAYLVWVDNQSYSQVYLAESHDGGSTWSTREIGDLTGNYYRYMYPSVSISPNGIVHLMYYRMNNSNKFIQVIYRNYSYEGGYLSPEVVVDSWTNTHSFIGDYATIVADRFGNVSLGYTTENPGDNAMFATMPLPLKIESVDNSSHNGVINDTENLNVSARISSYTEVKNVLLFYRFENESTYNVTNMTLVDGDNFNGRWNATIYTSNHSGKLYFYVYANDSLEKSDTSGEYAVDVNPTIPELWIPAIVAIPAALILFRRR